MFGLLVDLLRLGPFLDLTLDDPFTDFHAEMVHRGGFRKREHIDAFEPVSFLRAGICELLPHDGTGNDARHRNLDIGFENRRRQVAT